MIFYRNNNCLPDKKSSYLYGFIVQQ